MTILTMLIEAISEPMQMAIQPAGVVLLLSWFFMLAPMVEAAVQP